MVKIVQERKIKRSAANIKRICWFSPLLFSKLSTWIIYAAPIAVHAHGLMALQYSVLGHHWHILRARTSLSAVLAYTLWTLLNCWVFSKVYFVLLLSLMHSAQAFMAVSSPAAHTPCPTPWTPFSWSSLKFFLFQQERMFFPPAFGFILKERVINTLYCQIKDRGTGMTDRLPG